MLRKILLFLFVLCAIRMYGQNTKAEGVVYDDSHRPVPGATVVIKGGAKGVSTDSDGKFSLDAEIDETLVFSFVGMQEREFVFDGRYMEVVLHDATLDEVVVIGYQTIRKADLTGAVSVFKPDLMKNRSVTGTVADVLGTLPGLNVRTAGNPGAEGKVVIRGPGTFGDANPLYVVDGIVGGANRDFNFNDIESIQVLKDASAAAIYGSRAANGVIIITTKKGKEGKMAIDVGSKVSVQWLPKYNLTTRDEWIKLNDMAFDNAEVIRANHSEGNTDWQKETFKPGVIHDHNISFSGGGVQSSYFISGNFQNNSGTTVGTKSERITLRSNTSASRDFGDKVKFNFGENIILSKYTVDELDTNPVLDVFRMLPTIPIYDTRNASKGGYGFGDTGRDVTFGTNPVARENLEETVNGNLRVRGNAFAELELFKMFKYKLSVGFDFSNDTHKYLRKVGDWTLNQPKDPSSLNKNQAQSGRLVYDNTLEFNKAFGRHNVSAVAGTSFETNDYEQIWGTKNNVIMTSMGHYFDQLDAAMSDPKTGSFRDCSKLFSMFGRVNYNFDDKYLFSFTVRRDESSKFNTDGRVGYFPSVSAAWRISKEAFFETSLINDLKIRTNYGTLGNSNIGAWEWVSLINAFPQAIFGDDQHISSGMIQTKLVDMNLKWEVITQTNLGLDISLLNNRLQLSADYFIKDSKDVLAPMPILDVTGNSGGNPLLNAASIKNSGVELSLTWGDNVGEVKYSVNLNGTYLKNKITSLGDGRKDGFDEWNTKSDLGKPIGEWYLIKTDGIFKTDAEVQAHRNSAGVLIQPDAQKGDVRYVDGNDDGQITDADRQHCGSNTPKLMLGSNITLQYKGFDILMQITGAFGHKIFNGPRSAYDRFDDNSNYRADYDPWSIDNPNAKDPRPVYNDSRNSRGNQDRWLENGNYLRLSQFALGYTLPQSLLKNTFKQIRAYVNLQNMITLTSYTGLDPEFLNTNIWMRSHDYGAFPNPRGLTFGIQLSF